MPSVIVVRTPAKLNLSFNILGIRPDRFHEIETVFQAITLEDELRISFSESAEHKLEITCRSPEFSSLIPLDETNLIAKAAREFASSLPPGSKKLNTRVKLEKRIPVGAGLAGGSANAAGMLLAMNEALLQPFSLPELMQLAATVGSDVPFCLKGGTCLGRGRGEILNEVSANLPLLFCIIKPRHISVSTPWAYAAFDQHGEKTNLPCLEKVISGLTSADLKMTLEGFANVFEPVVFRQYPELSSLKEQVIAQGALACHMTGSGPTLFAAVDSQETAHRIRRHLELLPPERLSPVDFFLAESCPTGARVVSYSSY